MIHEGATVDPTAVIGPNVVIGDKCKIGAGTKISNSTLLAGSEVKAYSYMDGSILGWKSTVGSWCRITKLTVVAEDVQIKDETYLNGTKVLPHKGINGSHPEEGKIIM